jgi:hypothetical protein
MKFLLEIEISDKIFEEVEKIRKRNLNNYPFIEELKDRITAEISANVSSIILLSNPIAVCNLISLNDDIKVKIK